MRLLSEDGVWAFVCTADPTRRRGWVPASMLKKKGGSQLRFAGFAFSIAFSLPVEARLRTLFSLGLGEGAQSTRADFQCL